MAPSWVLGLVLVLVQGLRIQHTGAYHSSLPRRAQALRPRPRPRDRGKHNQKQGWRLQMTVDDGRFTELTSDTILPVFPRSISDVSVEAAESICRGLRER